MSSSTPLRVAICGAGPGGLSLALSLGKYSSTSSPIAIDLYEAQDKITTAGAGVTMWKRTWFVMKSLGLDEALVEKTGKRPEEKETPGMTWRKADELQGGFQFYRQSVPFGSIGLHRADLVDVFTSYLPSTCTVHVRKRLTHYTSSDSPTGPVTLHFTDGSTATADILVGADGIRSPTRATMFNNLASSASSEEEAESFRSTVNPVWSGVVCYRSLVPVEELDKAWTDHPTKQGGFLYCGKDKHVVAYPVSQGRFVNVAAFRTDALDDGTPYPHEKWVSEVPKEEVTNSYLNFEPQLRALVNCMEKPSRWAVHVMKPIPTYVSGNVALIGDAAHAMKPHFGTGAGQAIEDAYILARIICHSHALNLPVSQALKVYEDARLLMATDVLVQGRLTGFLYEFNLPGFYNGSEGNVGNPTTNGVNPPANSNGDNVQAIDKKKQALTELGREIEKKWYRANFEGVPDDEWMKAKKVLERMSTDLSG